MLPPQAAEGRLPAESSHMVLGESLSESSGELKTEKISLPTLRQSGLSGRFQVLRLSQAGLLATVTVNLVPQKQTHDNTVVFILQLQVSRSASLLKTTGADAA